MGDTLNEQMLTAFVDELGEIEKEAGLKELGQRGLQAILKRVSPQTTAGMLSKVKSVPGATAAEEVGTLAQRIRHPIAGMQEGYRSMSPAYMAERGAAKMLSPAELEAAQASGKRAIDVVKGKAQDLKGRIGPLTMEESALMEGSKNLAGKGMLGRYGEHVLDPNVGLREAYRAGGAKGVAEQLSRSGWTGAQGWSKYVPMGEKSMMTGFAAGSIPSLVNAKDPTVTGEGGGLERGLEQAGHAGGWMLGAGLGLPGALAWMGAPYVGKRLGRILDRTRAGANVDQALFAPSPEEATQQMQTIQRHYG